MSSQIAVNSIDSLKDLRVALALYGEDTLGALGAITAEVRRTNIWLHQEQPAFWQEQIKRRRERLSSAKAELFRKQLSQSSSSGRSQTEQVENVRRAEAHLVDAEKRLVMTRKWQGQFQQVVLEYHASVRRIKSLAAGEVPGGVNLLSRLIDALEAYLSVSVPSGSSIAESSSTPPAQFQVIASQMIAAEPATKEIDAEEQAEEFVEDGEVLELDASE
jgi:hypothetical protein